MKKYILTALVIFLNIWNVKAQEFKMKLPANKTVKIMVNRSEVKVEGYSGDEVHIKALDYEAPPERAKGLKPLTHSGTDNTGIGLHIEEKSNDVIITDATARTGEYVVKVPQNARISVTQNNWGNGDMVIRNMKNEIEVVGKTGTIELINVTGPIVANNISGDIKVSFSNLSQQAPTMISVVSGDIDITIPSTADATFELSTISGEIYTDLEMKLKGDEKENLHQIGGHSINSSLNKGGVKVGLKTISGNIYLRKAK